MGDVLKFQPVSSREVAELMRAMLRREQELESRIESRLKRLPDVSGKLVVRS